MINKDFQLTTANIKMFKKDGYLVLRNFFATAFLNRLKELAEINIKKPNTNYGSGFSKLRYDIGNNEEFIFDLIQNKKFGNTLFGLTEKELLFTQGLAFELEKNKSTGFPWHVGTQSFGFHQKEDYGCTIWIPFVK